MEKEPDYDNLINQYFSTGSIIDNIKNETFEEDKIDLEPKFNNNIVIGIDLGTTNTCVSIWRNGNLEVIPDEFGNRTIPSYVAYTNKSRYIGYEAKNQKELNPKNVFYEVKRLIGRKYNDTSIQADKEYFTFDIIDNNNNILLQTINKQCSPEEISAIILNKVKIMASEYLKENINKAIITVPAYFNDAQRQATKDAAKIAGLDCLRIINEPTAAALAYGLLNKSIRNTDTSMNIIVYDLGG